MERLCLECGASVVGRTDKKFCDEACRNNYNNNLRSGELNYLRKVNGILKKNRSILQANNPTGKAKVKLKSLQASGFDFDYSTQVYKTAKGDMYYFCYEYGYLLLPPEHVLLVKRDEEK